jgi:dephospho-CoA kinase
MIRVGVTGLMASGKSTVARRFQKKGAELLDGDAFGWEVLRQANVREALAGAFGPRVIGRDGEVDRAALGRIVFRDPDSLERLNRIVQPVLRERVRAELLRERSAPVLALDAALLTSWRLEGDLDGVVEVFAPPRARAERLKAARSFSEEEAWERIRGQTLPAVQGARRYWRVDNVGSVRDLEARADAIWDELIALSPRAGAA